MVTVIKDTEKFLDVLSRADLSENAYLSYDYYETYLKYNKINNFMCFCMSDDSGNTVGLLPLYKKGVSYKIVGYRASNYLGYICRANDTELVDKEISLYIENNYPNMIIDFYDINSGCVLYELLDKQEGVVKVPLYSCPYVDCEQEFEALFHTQVPKSKKRAELKKFANKLQLVGEVELVNIDDEESWEKYGILIKDIYKVHAERFAEVYIPDDVCLHKNEEYYTELFERLVRKQKALLSILRVGGVTVSFLYTAVSDGIVMDWMPAFDPAFAKYNLGTVHLMKLLEYLCGNSKYRILDFSKGAAVYKERWAKAETCNYMMVKLYRKNLINCVKTKLLVYPILLKNKLRETGQLDKIKKVIVKIKGTKSKESTSSLESKVLSEIPQGASSTEFDYGLIRDLSIEDRKRALDAVYEGKQPLVIEWNCLKCILIKDDEQNEI